MGRPPLRRTVARLPKAVFFKPAGVPVRNLEQVGLGVDEVEALRLVDLEGFSQEEAAAGLGVSRQTVGRILEQARRKVADALVNGKAVLIGGGAYTVAQARLCASCGHRWLLPEACGRLDVAKEQSAAGAASVALSQGPAAGGSPSAGTAVDARAEVCPSCGSAAVRACPGRGRRGGGRGGHGARRPGPRT